MNEEERREKRRVRQREWLREKRAKDREASRAEVAAWRAANPEKVKESRRQQYAKHRDEQLQAAKRAHAADQAASVQRAERTGEVWTGAEDRIVMDRSLTIREIAARTSRTFHATRRRRAVLDAGERERAASVAAAHAEAESRMRP